ncbi:epsin N-terminal-likey (ENTH) domain containing protein [Histomonas meleagridis]|uniref:epsin N-terminal-likey (ENTH) domain containing protein n=1 Tax=Histomonas meleagridis TaxID=135588 RepID=UPI003559E321|nr:epsin N-terminal-likey (ENTH) domain containing protein [Histomonas meleagridis]KAH0802309.1 epsin N-terminal-likey (ENTH) domain containing protein [Histomonas meleagridis]
MFAISRIIERATTNDDNQIPESVVAEALDLCAKDKANTQKIVRGLSLKLTNTFVIVRIKALIFLQALVQYGPPEFKSEVRLVSSSIKNCLSWIGDPHPSRGMEPYEEMRDVAQTLLASVNVSLGRPSKFASAAFPEPEPAPTQPQSITTPYPQQTTAATPSYQNPYQTPSHQASITTPYPQQTPANYSQPVYTQYQSKYGTASNVPPTTQRSRSNIIEDITHSLGKWFKTTFSVGGGFNTYQQNPYQPQSQYNYSPQQTYGYSPQPEHPQPFEDPYQHRSQTASLTLSEQHNRPQPSKPKRDFNSLRPKKVPQHLSPAKKLMKITGGRAMANASELTAFKQNISVDSIDELIEGLTNKDWKVAVRAILGLEVAAEVYGIQSIAKCKNEILTLTGAPQASLRNEANKLYPQIKNVAPAAPIISAFSFTSEGTENNEDSAFNFEQGEDEKKEEEVEKTEENHGNEQTEE